MTPMTELPAAGTHAGARAFALSPAHHGPWRRAGLVMRRSIEAGGAQGVARAPVYDRARAACLLDMPEGGTGA